MNPVFSVVKLEKVLQLRLFDFIDNTQLLRAVMEHVRNTEFLVLKQQKIPDSQVKLSITKFEIVKQRREFELWAEFSIPKDNGVVIGTLVCSLSLDGQFDLRESFGTFFVPETLDHV